MDTYQDKLEKAYEKLDIFRDKMQTEIERYKQMYQNRKVNCDATKEKDTF